MSRKSIEYEVIRDKKLIRVYIDDESDIKLIALMLYSIVSRDLGGGLTVVGIVKNPLVSKVLSSVAGVSLDDKFFSMLTPEGIARVIGNMSNRRETIRSGKWTIQLIKE